MYMIFCAVVPVFILILIGMIVDRLQLLPESTPQSLSLFVLNVSIPCLTFHIMCEAPLDRLLEWRWWLGVLGVQLLFMGLFYLLDRRRGEESGPAVISSLSVSFCNVGFVGLPVIMNVFENDAEALTVAGLMVVAANVLVIIAQMALIAWSRQRRGEAAPEALPPARRAWLFFRRYILSNAVLVSTLAGLAVPVLGLTVWEPLDRAVTMLGYLAPGCMLFILGLSLRANVAEAVKARALSFGRQLWIGAWRLAGMPLITMAALLALGIDPKWVCVTTIASACGTAVFVSALAQIYRVSAGQACLTVALTNLLSLFSITGVIWLLNRLALLPAGLAF
ncbi:MAG: AEC family transporter [Desulfovibrionaceae bacterium]|nr:AEC family transporter [Desulfovibrionaceae bacterium]